MDIRIRPGGRKDQELVWRVTMETVWNDIAEDERRELDRAQLEDHFRPNARRVIESPENAFFIAETTSGEALGYAIVGGASSMLSPVPFGFLYDIWVAPSARRRGVARGLLARAEDWCRAQGFRRLKLEVAAGNAAARALYASGGFRDERIFMGRAL